MADVFSPEKRSSIMRQVHGSNTAPELLIRSTLHRLGYRFRLHRKDLPGTPDIVLPGRKSVVFVHGCFWHGHKCPRGTLPSSNREFWQQKITKNQERDRRVQKQLRSEGWKVLTVWQCQTKDQTTLVKRLSRFFEQPIYTQKSRACFA